jgi:hypothetical protein
MTHDEILEMARQSGASKLVTKSGVDIGLTSSEKLIDFAKMVAEKEREECAELAWIHLIKHSQPWNVRQEISNAIKARGQE